MTKKTNSEIILEIRDDGVGMPESFDWKQSDSLGLHIVHLLVDQIEGTIELNRDKGTEFRIIIKR